MPLSQFKGVRILSEFNLSLSCVLLAFVIIAGPTGFLFQALSENVGNCLSSLVRLSLRTFVYESTTDPGWFGGWTILYWAWWIAWSPFVGMFIARISRGRTIREFVVGVLLVPTAFMRRCDHFKDSDKARQDMREQILETPLHHRKEWLDYFTAQTQQKARP